MLLWSNILGKHGPEGRRQESGMASIGGCCKFHNEMINFWTTVTYIALEKIDRQQKEGIEPSELNVWMGWGRGRKHLPHFQVSALGNIITQHWKATEGAVYRAAKERPAPKEWKVGSCRFWKRSVNPVLRLPAHLSRFLAVKNLHQTDLIQILNLDHTHAAYPQAVYLTSGTSSSLVYKMDTITKTSLDFVKNKWNPQ